MEARIKKGNNVMMKNILKLKHDNSWAVQNEAIKQEMEIKDVQRAPNTQPQISSDKKPINFTRRT